MQRSGCGSELRPASVPPGSLGSLHPGAPRPLRGPARRRTAPPAAGTGSLMRILFAPRHSRHRRCRVPDTAARRRARRARPRGAGARHDQWRAPRRRSRPPRRALDRGQLEDRDPARLPAAGVLRAAELEAAGGRDARATVTGVVEGEADPPHVGAHGRLRSGHLPCAAATRLLHDVAGRAAAGRARTCLAGDAHCRVPPPHG